LHSQWPNIQEAATIWTMPCVTEHLK